MTVTDSVRSALETDSAATSDTAIESHLHPTGSFDPEFFGVPSGREEIWRFTPLKRLKDLHKDAPLSGTGLQVTVDAPETVRAESVLISDDLRGSSGIVPRDRVAARAWQAAERAYVVDISPETEPSPITVSAQGLGADTATAGHLIIRAQKFSQATVVVEFSGSASLAENVEIIVEDGANLTVVSVQDWEADAVHVSTQHAKVGRDAALKHVAVSVGGAVVRHDFTAQYDGPGGSVDAYGLYFADGGTDGSGQHIEHRLLIDHTAPKTRSNVLYKGALQGEGAHSVWIGNILIRKVAEGIETFEENRNLVLTDGCQADSVPNLEIETGEIEGAGHASTVGRFDDNHLFYLQSRGISAEEARRLVVHGFFDDIIRRIGVPELQDKLVAVVKDELADHIGQARP